MTIKQQISEALANVLQPLRTSAAVEEIRRVRSLTDASQHSSAILYILGDEELVEESNLGYVLEFPVNFRCTLRTNSGVFAALENLKGQVQTALETDPQLGSLIVSLTYQGEVDITETDRPGFVLVYQLVYRRRRANPSAVY